MNKYLSLVSAPRTIELADKVRTLEREGNKIIKFQTGDPNFQTHIDIVTALNESISRGETHYTNSQGLLELREAISNIKQETYRVSVEPNKEIIVTSGAAQGIYLSLAALLNPFDEVILFEPYYPQYEYIIKFLGGSVKTIPAFFNSFSHVFEIDFDIFQEMLSEKTKILIINSPNNPSGKIYSREEIERIIEISKKRNIYILADEVYCHIVDKSKKHVSFLEYPEIFERLIYINSFSKTYAMTGWRLGYIISHKEIIDQIVKLLRLNTTCVQTFIQRAGIVALQSSNVRQYVNRMIDKYNERRISIYNSIKHHPMFGTYPDGAFYYLLRLPDFTPKGIDLWAQKLLEKELVAVVPAYVYGNSVNNFIRISFSIDDQLVTEGLNRLINFYNLSNRKV